MWGGILGMIQKFIIKLSVYALDIEMQSSHKWQCYYVLVT